MRRAFWPTLLGVMLILSGIFCLFSPVTSSTVIPYMIGIALTATGIGKLMRRADERRFYGQSSWSLAGAVVSLIFGILLMVSPTLQLSMGTTVVVLIGCWITIMGILRIVHAFQLDYDYGNTSDRTCFSAAEGDRICGYFWPTGQQ